MKGQQTFRLGDRTRWFADGSAQAAVWDGIKANFNGTKRLKCQLWGLLSAFLGFVVGIAFLATTVRAGETNSPSPTPIPVNHASAPSQRELAAQHEQAGRKREAAALYEEMARTNTAARKVLSHRLVTIYTEIGETNKALTWAREVMRDNPDPQAYLAAVQARLGQSREAQETLEREIARNANVTRAVTLRWQLADIYEKNGESEKSQKLIKEAAVAARGTALETAANQRFSMSNADRK